LVDPDNRRAVDYAALEAKLAALDERRGDRAALLRDLLANFANGSLKLFVVSELLRLRRDLPELFQSGYAALDTDPNIIAFARGARTHGERPSELVPELLCVVPRFPFRITRGRTPWPLGACFGSQRLSGPNLAGCYRQLFTGAAIVSRGTLELSEIFAEFPLAVLLRIDAERADEWLDPEAHAGELRASQVT
jgi:(1->4)-alpha-D-glucan 1-alpha-D-glucosylmutase